LTANGIGQIRFISGDTERGSSKIELPICMGENIGERKNVCGNGKREKNGIK
jgi:hypothetical protein